MAQQYHVAFVIVVRHPEQATRSSLQKWLTVENDPDPTTPKGGHHSAMNPLGLFPEPYVLCSEGLETVASMRPKERRST